MQSQTFRHFEIGMVDDPSIEDRGGFEFASGMDIFSEPGVLKACDAMTEVSYGTGAAPTTLPRWMVDTGVSGGSGIRAYIAAGAKILESTDGTTWNLFLTNGNGENLGLGIWNGYVVYPADTKIGRAPVGDGASKNDSYLTTLDSDSEFHPVIRQGGTLKIGAGRYVASLDESFNFTARAMKLTAEYRIRCLAEYLTNLYMGTRVGDGGGAVLNLDSSVFAWRGTVLSSGSALPDTPYPMKLRGMNALLVDGRRLYAFPDNQGHILIFDGAGFVELRKLTVLQRADGGLIVQPGAVNQHVDNSILFAGNSVVLPGVFQMKDGAICQSYVPSAFTPGVDAVYNIGFVKTSFNGLVLIGYFDNTDSSYHIEKSDSSNKQDNAIVRTLWHRMKTDRLKRWAGIKLNLKPLAASTSVAVAYRTDRDASFTDSGYTITSSNQDKPVIFGAQPRSRELQFKLTYTTNGADTPELLSYDPIFEVLKTIR